MIVASPGSQTPSLGYPGPLQKSPHQQTWMWVRGVYKYLDTPFTITILKQLQELRTEVQILKQKMFQLLSQEILGVLETVSQE